MILSQRKKRKSRLFGIPSLDEIEHCGGASATPSAKPEGPQLGSCAALCKSLRVTIGGGPGGWTSSYVLCLRDGGRGASEGSNQIEEGWETEGSLWQGLGPAGRCPKPLQTLTSTQILSAKASGPPQQRSPTFFSATCETGARLKVGSHSRDLVCVVLDAASSPSHNTTQPGEDTELRGLGTESHKHRLQLGDPEHMETVWESETLSVSFASCTEVTAVRRSLTMRLMPSPD